MKRPGDNPFAGQRVLEIRYRLPPGLTWEELLDRLAALRWRGAIVGPHGHGKTTLLEDLAPRLEGRGFRVQPISLAQLRRFFWGNPGESGARPRFSSLS